jgi:hypothetical protein
MSAAAVVVNPVLPIRNQSLYQIEERLEMLFGSEDFIDPNGKDAEHLRVMLVQEIAETLQAELTKVDGIANYLAWLEQQQAFAEAEITRLKLRKAKFERRQERVESMVMKLLQAHRRPRIEGHTTFLALHGCPPSLEILNEDAIPMEYKTAVITSEMKIEKDKIRRALKVKTEVPGCRLITDRKRLVHG